MLEEEYQQRRVLPPHLRAPEPEEAPFSFEIRAAEPSDVPSIREIYNHYVLNSSITLSIRNRGPQANDSDTKSSDQLRFSSCGIAIRA